MSIDFGYSEVQEMMRKTAREFFEKECPRTLVREVEDKELDYSPELHRKMAELGFLGIAIPEEYGGQGGDIRDLVVFCEEAGRAMVPGPYFSTAAIGAPAILRLGSEAQKRHFLPAIVRGERTIALALTEEAAGYAAHRISTTASADNGQFVINGQKMWVPGAAAADYLLLVAQTNPNSVRERGMSLFLVDAKSPGITISPFHTMGGERLNRIELNGVRVPGEALLGELDRGWLDLAPILDQAKVALGAWMVGGAQVVLEMTVDYAKLRVQFGRPIGSFQDQQIRIATMWMATDGARLQAYKVASLMAQGKPCAQEAAMVKITAAEAYRLCTYEGIHVHGGVGFMKEFDLQLFYRRARAAELFLGSSDAHKDFIAETLLGPVD